MQENLALSTRPAENKGSCFSSSSWEEGMQADKKQGQNRMKKVPARRVCLRCTVHLNSWIFDRINLCWRSKHPDSQDCIVYSSRVGNREQWRTQTVDRLNIHSKAKNCNACNLLFRHRRGLRVNHKGQWRSYQLVSWLFFQINKQINYVLFINNSAEEIQDRYCYSEETSYWIYGFYTYLKYEQKTPLSAQTPTFGFYICNVRLNSPVS